MHYYWHAKRPDNRQIARLFAVFTRVLFYYYNAMHESYYGHIKTIIQSFLLPHKLWSFVRCLRGRRGFLKHSRHLHIWDRMLLCLIGCSSGYVLEGRLEKLLTIETAMRVEYYNIYASRTSLDLQ